MVLGKDVLVSAWLGLAAFGFVYGSILLIRAYA